LRQDLDDKGLFVLSLRPKQALAGLSIQLPQRQSLSTREFLIFNQELATLLKSGMPLVQSLDLLRRRVLSPVFRGVLDDVYEKVKAGTAMSEAFGSHSALVSRVYTASLLAGERSGNLDSVLRRYVEYSKVIATVKRKAVSALVYPAVLISLALVLVAIIVLRVIPEFSDFYASFGATLPLQLSPFTRLLLSGAYVVPLAKPGDDVKPEDFVCFRFDGAKGLYIHPNIWHEGVFSVAGRQRFFDKQGAVHARVSVDFAREFGCLIEAAIT
jgi:type II secretory pathway component PulF